MLGVEFRGEGARGRGEGKGECTTECVCPGRSAAQIPLIRL